MPRRISDFPHPHPGLIDPPKEILRYKRADGVELNATLYTPPGYDASSDGPLPTIMWAYPREFNSAEAAGQLGIRPFDLRQSLPCRRLFGCLVDMLF